MESVFLLYDVLCKVVDNRFSAKAGEWRKTGTKEIIKAADKICSRLSHFIRLLKKKKIMS